MVTEVKAPARAGHVDLFLAGGIMGVGDWQQTAIELLADVDIVAANPRRAEPFQRSFQEDQVAWEHKHLKAAETVLFWFPPETLCPITLFELGVFTMRPDTPIFVGTHPDYQRRIDVEIQLGIARPEVVVRNTLEDVVADVAAYWSKRS